MRKLYGLLTNPRADFQHPVIVQVSFDREELEEIAKYLNEEIKYFSPRAEVIEIDDDACCYYWPAYKR